MLDLIGAACLILVLSPLLLAIAVLVKLDGGPVLYAHPRVGMGKRRFRCLKFRSMKQGSAAMLEHMLSVDPVAAMEWNATQKLRNDPRVTRIGAFLRKTSLDELPQLFNVLRLEMSLVGPRPIIDDEIEFYGSDIAFYYATRPGLTGLWQVNGRSNTTYRQRVQLDTWYVKAWTLWQDVVILARTVPAVLKRTGAV
jgi:undecaprenyl-phosphate galactose phosphotransferase